MEKALMISGDHERLMSAADVQREYHGCPPQSIDFICPLCHQPLFPASMKIGGKQEPHFRHERNNLRAHKCELYANALECSSSYQRIPLQMFIRPSRNHDEWFVIEGGFRKLEASRFNKLCEDGAKLKIGRKCYKVTDRRFGNGLTKLPFEEISLNCENIISLTNTAMTLTSTWGYLENAKHAMVFTRDAETQQGKRFTLEDTISFETDLFLLAPEAEHNRILRAFSNARKVGYAGSKYDLSHLSVYEVRLTKDDENRQEAVGYIQECGFKVSENSHSAELIWPPSLVSSGELIPMFNDTSCIFTAETKACDNSNLHIHTADDESDYAISIPLICPTMNGYGFAILEKESQLRFITTGNSVFSTPILLRPDADKVKSKLSKVKLQPSLTLVSKNWTLKVKNPLEAKCLSKQDGVRTVKLDEGNSELSFKSGQIDCIVVRKKLENSSNYFELSQEYFDCIRKPDVIDIDCSLDKTYKQSHDMAFAIARQAGKHRDEHGNDWKRARRRKAKR